MKLQVLNTLNLMNLQVDVHVVVGPLGLAVVGRQAELVTAQLFIFCTHDRAQPNQNHQTYG